MLSYANDFKNSYLLRQLETREYSTELGLRIEYIALLYPKVVGEKTLAVRDSATMEVTSNSIPLWWFQISALPRDILLHNRTE